MSYKNSQELSPATTRKFRKRKVIILLLFAMTVLFPYSITQSAETPRYEVVTGSGENAYLVNTTTGQVWILTYRTLGTGREPVAIPYKFVKISPKNQNEFLMEQIEADRLTK
jgi:hypothetical protein